MDAEIVGIAQGIADEVLFPAALATDAAEVVPLELLDALADAGLYGLAGPAEAGGLDADFPTVCAVIEALASGCLTTAFVWAQHLGAVHTVAAGESAELRREWLEPLCRGTRRAGLALGGALPQPTLHAQRVDEGWRVGGTTPWLSGWGRIDVVHTAARADGEIVWSLVDASALRVDPLELAALQATATVRAHFDAVVVPHERVTGVVPVVDAPLPNPEVLRIHSAFALGVARRCSMLLGPGPLAEELDACRAALDAAAAETMPHARAAAADLALRAAASVMATEGSRAILREQHGQRLAREALFMVVYALRPPVRSALLESLATSHVRRSSR